MPALIRPKLSKIRLRSVRGMRRPEASTLTAYSIGRASDARPVLAPSHASLTFRQSVVKVAGTRNRVDSYTVCRFLHGGT